MKNKIGFITIGQAGGNIGLLFKNESFDVVFINSSQGDLDTLNVDTSKKYHISNGFGCAKDRKVAKKLMKDDFNSVNQFIQQGLGEKEFYYLIFSSSGGTGSGSSPVLASILANILQKNVGIITILPSGKDTLQAHINAYECLQEISNLENIGSTFVLDNNKNTNLEHINKCFVKKFTSIFDYKKFETTKGNIDEAEILKLLTTKGMINIATCQNTESTKALIEDVNKSIFAPLENDSKIKYLGLSKGIKFDEEMFCEKVGRYLDKFENINNTYTLAILSGLTLPFKRVLAMKEKITSEKEIIVKLQKDEVTTKLEDLDFLSEAITQNNIEETEKSEKKKTIDDIFDDFFK